MRAIDRHALGLVDRSGITVIDMRIALEIDGDASAIVEPNGQCGRRGILDGAERSILHAEIAFILQEQDAVVVGKLAHTTLGAHRNILAELAMRGEALAGRLIEDRKSTRLNS